MSFTTVTFIVFLFAVFGLHWVWRNRRWQNAVLLAASYCFYGWWDYRFLALIAASTLVDYGVGLGIARSRSPAARRGLLVLSIVFNIGLLGFFKYFNFFAESLSAAAARFG